MPSPLPPATAPRGFSLVEAAIALAIVTVIAAMSYVALGQLKRKATFGNVAVELAADLNAARQRAIAEQRSVWVVLLRATGNPALPDRYTEVLDGDGNFDLASYDPDAAVASPDVLLADRTLALPMRFGPDSGYGALPAGSPFAAVPTNLSVTFASLGYGGAYDTRAALEFQADGTVRLSSGASTGSISFSDPPTGRKQVIAVIAPTASFRVY